MKTFEDIINENLQFITEEDVKNSNELQIWMEKQKKEHHAVLVSSCSHNSDIVSGTIKNYDDLKTCLHCKKFGYEINSCFGLIPFCKVTNCIIKNPSVANNCNFYVYAN